MARSPSRHRVTIENTGVVIECASNQTILQAALEAGIDYPYTCASGNCGTCISHLKAGKVSMLPRSDASISPQQIKAGLTLGCRARPRGECTIAWLGRTKT